MDLNINIKKINTGPAATGPAKVNKQKGSLANDSDNRKKR